MGKNNKKRKRAAAAAQREQQQQHSQQARQSASAAAAAASETVAAAAEDDEELVHGISPEELLITVDTLQALSNYCTEKSAGSETTCTDDAHNMADATATGAEDSSGALPEQRPDLLSAISQKRYKELRTALHPFLVALKTRYEPHASSSYQSRVTSALQSRRWTDAYTALKGCLDLEVGETGLVKRGTVQRWVRLCDDCPHPNLKLKILRSVLACTPQDDAGTDGGCDGASQKGSGDSTYGGLNKHDPRRVLAEYEQKGTAATMKKIGDDNESSDEEDEADTNGGGRKTDGDEMKIIKSTTWTAPSSEVSEEVDVTDAISHLKDAKVETVHHVPAAERKPANHYDLTIYATPPDTVRILAPTKPTKRHDINLIPGDQYGAFLLTNVLSAAECEQLLHIAETKMKYIPDHPTSSPEPTGIDTCEWLVDSSILDPILERIMPHLNQTVHGEKVAGVNARWRLFRYGEERTYRPHIDGSWPGSGRDANTGKYTSDVFNGDRRSRYTFLIYLNEGFDGGGTTFYLPATNGADGFETVSVKPSRGSVLLFPQGNTASLLHEGSRVTGGGLKYVVRTDLLYHLKNKEY